jgi:hypothetical protein
MSGHFVSHVGSRGAKTCWRAGCNRPATDSRNARFYCPAHYEPGQITPDFEHVKLARRMMANTGGALTLSDVAGRLGLPTAALDLAMWRYLGRQA